ncbi:MAG TPA: restriction endonuclease subunit S [Bacteroidales bacterium]|nr:restriction endonuclease subunit S [Bacteroidales bacterium]
MSKTKKIIPEFRFPEFKGEWSLEELGQCLDYLQPTPFLVDNTDYNDEYEIPVLTAGKSFILGYTNEQEGIFNENLPVIIFDDFTTASQFVDFPFKTKSSAMKILLAKNDNDIKFVYESMQTLNYEVGVHKRHWISVFSKLRIAVPKPQEQQKIASCLSSLDELIAAHKDKLDALKDHKKGLLQNLFPQDGEKVPKLRFKEFENSGEWEEKKISDLGETISGLTGKSKDDFGAGKPFVTYKQVFDNSEINFEQCERVQISDDENQTSLQQGDILFTTSSETPNEVGFASVLIDFPKEKTYLNSFCFALRPFNIEKTQPQFSRYLFHSPIYRRSVTAIAQGSTRYNISKGAFVEIQVPIPAPTEQQKIASCLSSLDEVIEAQVAKIEQLKLHKKGLMQGLFPKIND